MNPARIKALREKHGWSQETLANLLCLDGRASISRYESGTRVPPKSQILLLRLAERDPKLLLSLHEDSEEKEM